MSRHYTLPRYRREIMAARAWAIETYNPRHEGQRARAFMARWQKLCDATAAEILDIAPDAPGASDGATLADDVGRWLGLGGDQE